MPLTPLRLRGNRTAYCYRLLHILALTTALTCLYAFAIAFVGVSSVTRQRLPLRPTIIYDDTDLASDDDPLIDLRRFAYLLNNRHICDNASHPLYFLLLVHSSPNHFSERMTIRSTWGSVTSFRSSDRAWSVRLVFLLGIPQKKLQRQINEENNAYGDIVQGNFIDSYRNLSYKHVMGYKWALSNSCSSTRYIVKADDDVFIDLFQLYELLQKVYGERPRDVLSCSVHPRGARPQRTGKWKVTVSEYPGEEYPPYCGGLAYVITPDLAKNLVRVSRTVPYFWIDDLYVTGLLAEPLQIQHHYLNLRTTYDTDILIYWLNELSLNGVPNESPCPYIFGNVEGFNRSKLMRLLWKKTHRLWGKRYTIQSSSQAKSIH